MDDNLVPYIPGKAELTVTCDGPKISMSLNGCALDLLLCCSEALKKIAAISGKHPVQALLKVADLMTAPSLCFVEESTNIDVRTIASAKRKMDEGKDGTTQI